MREMKDSEVEWIGEIPRDWRIAKFKFFFSIIGGCGFKEEYQGASQGDYPFLKASDINGSDRTVSSAKNYVNQDLVQQERYSIVPAYSIIIAKIGEALKKNHRKINTCDCIIDNNCEAFSLISSADSDLSYLYYVLSQIDMVWFDNGGTVPSINNEKLRDFFLPNPNNATQHRIADYLDAKCTQIDRAIARQQEVIEKLKAYKLSVITEAVTKGLNPDVPMKDSGIEWIGEIPEHWEVRKIRWDFSVDLGKMLDAKQISGQYLRDYLRNTDVQWNSINFENLPQMDFQDTELERYQIKAGDLLVCEGGEIGRCAIVPEGFPAQVFYQKALHRVRIRKVGNGNVGFLSYVMFCMSKNQYFFDSPEKATIAHLPAETLNGLRIPSPRKEEQSDIVQFLKNECGKIDEVAKKKQQVIDKLSEYKKSLIYEVVTGKREV